MKSSKFIYAILTLVALVAASLAGVDLGDAGATAIAFGDGDGGGEWG